MARRNVWNPAPRPMKTGISVTGPSLKDRIAQIVRPVCECLGYARFSRPALHQLDRRLEELMPRRNGWFVEAGANDGFQQSNTYYLARFKGWKGVLVEAVPHLAAACKKRRPESQVIACALGPPEKAGGTLEIRHAGLMSCICGAFGDEAAEQQRAAKGQAVQGLPVMETLDSVPVRTLDDVLEQCNLPSSFDLLSLDVEGYEIEVLRGLSLDRFQPQYICIEVFHTNRKKVADLLSSHYVLKEVLSESAAHNDYLWQRVIPPR